MTKADFRVDGLKELSAKLNQIKDKKAVHLAVKANTYELQQKIMQQTSIAYIKGYSTGATKKTAAADMPSPFVGQAGITRSYNPYTEYGTRYMKAEPVVKPAFEMQRPIFINDLKKLVK